MTEEEARAAVLEAQRSLARCLAERERQQKRALRILVVGTGLLCTFLYVLITQLVSLISK